MEQYLPILALPAMPAQAAMAVCAPMWKVLGTALVARIYALTRRSLLSLAWFQRYHDKLMEIKARLLAQLHASAGWRQLQRLRQSLREGMLRLRLRLAATPSSPLARILRLVRRLVARMRRR